MAGSSIDGVGLASLGVGSALLYAGIKGYSLLAVVQNLVTGKPITTNVTQTVPLTVPQENAPTGGVSMGRASGSGNKALGQSIANEYGWGTGQEWASLDKLFTQESSWDNHADNPSSHAYGIAQALPLTKMPKAAWPEAEGGNSDAATQIRWGLDYIKGRYGSPVMAWAHETTSGWY